MRQKFGAGQGLPRITGLRKLRNPEDIMDFIEELIFKFEKTVTDLNVDVVEVYCNLLRIQLSAIKEKSGKRSEKTLGFRMKGVS